MYLIENHIIGSDPEAFIVNQKDSIVSAIELVPGDKYDPYDIDKGCAVQHDNILVEWCIPPTKNSVSFYESMVHAIEWTKDILPGGFDIKFITSAYVDQDQLLHPLALEFGCEPDYNAWTNGGENIKPDVNTNLRTAGGHIHIGYNNSSEKVNMMLVKALDLFLSVPALFIDNDVDRRKLYGKAGAFRHKSYGVEYRSLSNFWLKDQQSVDWVFNQVQIAIDYINCGGIITEEEAIAIQLSVNKNNLELAKELMVSYSMYIPTFA